MKKQLIRVEKCPIGGIIIANILSTSGTFGKYTQDPIDMLEAAGHKVDIVSNVTTEDKMIENLRDKQALIVGVESVTREVLKKSPNLKIVAKHGVGIDNIDLEAAADKNVTVINAPGVNRHAVADYVFGLMLSLQRGIPKSFCNLQAGKWEKFVGNEIFKKTIGVIGTGEVGSEVIRRATGFNMNIIAYDQYHNTDLENKYGIQYVSREELLRESDFVTLHINLTEDTKYFISKEELEMMKNTGMLINTSRGGIVDEEALYEALKNNDIHAAALDVFEIEPVSAHSLLSIDRFIGTPHSAGYTEEALSEAGIITAENLINFFEA